MKKLTAILIGAGNRGETYTNIMRRQMPEKFQVVAVAEPIEDRRNYIKEKHKLSDDMCFSDWAPLLEKGKIADFAVIATMDRVHYAPAIAAIEAGYDLLLEKPIAPTYEECKGITEAAEKHGRKVVICTVLRYTDIFNTIKAQIDAGALGDIMSINHEEGVGNIHQTHSFVRGNWGNAERSSDMLLQKSCHDIDILTWLIGKKCLKVQSFGNLSFFTEKNAPKGAPDYCIDGCPKQETCPYYAPKLYLDDKDNYWFRSTSTHKVEPTDEDVEYALRNTQYGKCVYKCDNNVVDHQVVSMLYEDDIAVTFTMNAFNRGGRFIHIMGTKGDLHAAMDGSSPITVYDFETKEKVTVEVKARDGIQGGHGGGDTGILDDLYAYFTGSYDGKSVPEIRESYYSHQIVFAIEEARRTGTVVDVDEFIKNNN
ncbi:MAG: Gfo/Idh/MocA family oxidoreductase [Clostridia bacterium]|nr:Gfo/Idh/MocA family oxidoreductase [Clostridia bacterium]